MLKRLTSQPFWVNFLAAIILVFFIGFLFFVSLGFITKHGDTVRVPDVEGKSVGDARSLLQAGGFRVVIQDSLYTDSLPALTVLRQSPSSDAQVKVNRTVFLTINKVQPPMVAMPNLISYSFRSAVMTLESERLVMGDTLYRADFAMNTVLDQLYQGHPIAAGTLIPEGSQISLVLANGVGDTPMPVPNLIGKTLDEAKSDLSAAGLPMGALLFTGQITDTGSA
ncbi:MAG TPA: PASTA domain-containing protein, partial [Chitinophagaceae bacterium]|nr:PASTA domain-containing protein [Chitinophagaceae bacterium]